MRRLAAAALRELETGLWHTVQGMKAVGRRVDLLAIRLDPPAVPDHPPTWLLVDVYREMRDHPDQ